MAWENAEDFMSEEEWERRIGELKKIRTDKSDTALYMYMAESGRCGLLRAKLEEH